MINNPRDIYKMGLYLALKSKPGAFNSTASNKNKLHITYNEWDDMLVIFRYTESNKQTKKVFETYLGQIKTYVEEYNNWQEILKKEFQKRSKK